MEFKSIKEAMVQGTGAVAIRGWCYRERGSNNLRFIVLRDASEIIQCVIEKKNVSEKAWKDAESVHTETSMEIKGEIKADSRAPSGYELNVKDLKIDLVFDPPWSMDKMTAKGKVVLGI